MISYMKDIPLEGIQLIIGTTGSLTTFPPFPGLARKSLDCELLWILSKFSRYCLKIMLRRKPTRIELRGEDVEEYEKAKKMWTKETEKKEEDDSKLESLLDDSPMAYNDPKRIAKVHERIGYKPETVPSDGTATFNS